MYACAGLFVLHCLIIREIFFLLHSCTLQFSLYVVVAYNIPSDKGEMCIVVGICVFAHRSNGRVSPHLDLGGQEAAVEMTAINLSSDKI